MPLLQVIHHVYLVPQDSHQILLLGLPNVPRVLLSLIAHQAQHCPRPYNVLAVPNIAQGLQTPLSQPPLGIIHLAVLTLNIMGALALPFVHLVPFAYMEPPSYVNSEPIPIPPD